MPRVCKSLPKETRKTGAFSCFRAGVSLTFSALSLTLIHPSAWKTHSHRCPPTPLRRQITLGETTLRAEKKSDTALRYDLEMESRNVEWGNPALVYDEEKDLFRFRDGSFAFSHDHAD